MADFWILDTCGEFLHFGHQWLILDTSGRFRILEPSGRLWIFGLYWPILDTPSRFLFLIYSTFRGTLARLQLAVHNVLKVVGALPKFWNFSK